MIVELSRATPLDAGATGGILWNALQETGDTDVHSAADAISCCGEMIDRNWVTVARSGGTVMGFLARDGAEICALYTASHVRGRGIGRRLIEDAKSDVSCLYLRAAATNLGAQRFYRAAGFKRATPPAGASESDVPAMTYVWHQEAKAA